MIVQGSYDHRYCDPEGVAHPLVRDPEGVAHPPTPFRWVRPRGRMSSAVYGFLSSVCLFVCLSGTSAGAHNSNFAINFVAIMSDDVGGRAFSHARQCWVSARVTESGSLSDWLTSVGRSQGRATEGLRGQGSRRWSPHATRAWCEVLHWLRARALMDEHARLRRMHQRALLEERDPSPRIVSIRL